MVRDCVVGHSAQGSGNSVRASDILPIFFSIQSGSVEPEGKVDERLQEWPLCLAGRYTFQGNH